MKYIEIKADTNDADYVSAINEISDKDLEKIMPLIELIKKFDQAHEWGYNYPRSEYCTDQSAFAYYEENGITYKQFDLFSNYLPYHDPSIHSIEMIRIFVTEEPPEILL